MIEMMTNDPATQTDYAFAPPEPGPPAPVFFVGLDLGKAADFTALVALERVPGVGGGRPIYHLRHAERLALGMPYPRQVVYVATLLRTAPLAGHCDLVVDATGVGAAVVDLFREARLQPVPVIITGGARVSHEGGTWSVPKRDLIAALDVLLPDRLLVSRALPAVEVLVWELQEFRRRIDPITAHDSYAAWREGAHDDLVLATALACWWAERHKPAPIVSPGGVVRASSWRI